MTGTIENIARYQTGPGAQEEFPELAYHYMVEGAGQPFLCNDLNKRVWGSGAPTHNETRVHVCYIGDREPTKAQRAGIRACIIDAQQRLGRTLTIEGHRDAYATSCPGPTWPSWRGEVLP